MDRFRHIREVGKGSFGRALLVQNRQNSALQIIKEINFENISVKERQDVINEVTVLKLLRHDQVIRFRDAFVHGGKLCIVMDYASGGDLAGRINAARKPGGQPFTEERILDWFVQIALGMQHIHSKRILHRDLKAHNVFLTAADKIKIGDFGIARILKESDCAKTQVGTPFYLSPEICNDEPYNEKSDVWSLGCLLYELCTLLPPFDGKSLKSLVTAILREKYKPIPVHYSATVRCLIERMLQKDPEERPSISDILAVPALQRYIQRHTVAKAVAEKIQKERIRVVPAWMVPSHREEAPPTQVQRKPNNPQKSSPAVHDTKPKEGVKVHQGAAAAALMLGIEKKRDVRPYSQQKAAELEMKQLKQGRKLLDLSRRVRERVDAMCKQRQKYQEETKVIKSKIVEKKATPLPPPSEESEQTVVLLKSSFRRRDEEIDCKKTKPKTVSWAKDDVSQKILFVPESSEELEHITVQEAKFILDGHTFKPPSSNAREDDSSDNVSGLKSFLQAELGQELFDQMYQYAKAKQKATPQCDMIGLSDLMCQLAKLEV